MKRIQHIILTAIYCSLFACGGTEREPYTSIEPDPYIEPPYVYSLIDPCPDCGAEYRQLYEEIVQAIAACNMSRPIDSYNYPTLDWSTFHSAAERHAACQIPQNRLDNMSTQAVIQALWEYPFSPRSWLFGRYEFQFDFDTWLIVNAYIELTKRADAGVALLERIRCTPPVSGIKDNSELFELIISKQVFLSQLSDKEKKQAIIITWMNNEIRQEAQWKGYRDNSYRAITWLLIARILVAVDYAPFMEEKEQNNALRLFLDNVYYVYFPDRCNVIAPLIIKYVKEYIN